MDLSNLFTLLGDVVDFFLIATLLFGLFLGVLIPIGLVLFPKITIHCLEKFLHYNIEYNEYTLKRLEELK